MNIPDLRPQRRARIELIPLIDIIFFLLATFIMSSLSMTKNQAIPVNLPVVAAAQPQKQQDPIRLSLTANGTIYYNREAVSWEELTNRLSDLTTNDARIFISGDTKSEFGQIVAILDEVRRLGILKISIETATK